MNKAMLEAHCPRLAADGIIAQGNPNDDGMGIQLGLSAGGVAVHMDGALITAPFYPPESLLKGSSSTRTASASSTRTAITREPSTPACSSPAARST